MNKNEMKKVGLVALLFMLAMGSIAGYWAESINSPTAQNKDNNQITIGTAKAITGELEVAQEFVVSETLVPAGHSSKSVGNVVEEIKKPITARWFDNTNAVKVTDSVQGTLTITPTLEFVDGSDSTALRKLVTPVINYTDGQTITLQGSTINAEVKLTMAEPDNKQEYEAVKGKEVRVKLNYSVVVN